MIRRKEEFLRIITLIGSGVFPVASRAVIRNPSSRLKLTLTTLYEFETTSIVNYDSVTDHNTLWRIRGRDPGTGSLGQPYTAELIGSADPLRLQRCPTVYQIETGIKDIAVDVTQSAAVQAGATSISTGNWYIRASWEPRVEMPDRELEALFDKCTMDAALITQST